MLDRTVTYYKKPAPPGFVRHMFSETGLSYEDEQIAWAIRQELRGDTQHYADLAGMPKKLYSEHAAGVHKALMSELIRLAIIGWQTENQQK